MYRLMVVCCALGLSLVGCASDDTEESSSTGGASGIAGSAGQGGTGESGAAGAGGTAGQSGGGAGTGAAGAAGAGGTAGQSGEGGAGGGGSAGSGGTTGPTFGYPVYSQEDIDAWSTSSPEYTRLANSWAGNVNRPHTSYGTEISSAERDLLKDESGYMKVQAVLWAADAKPERRTKVATMLDELRSVASWQTDPGEQYRLVAGWACTNLAQAAAITKYQDPALTTFLVDTCYPILDWTNGPNWHASFADSRLAIAAYVGDPALWEDAKTYFNQRIGQSIYHSTYDDNKVIPLLNNSGVPHVGLTTLHWGGGVGASQINSDFTPVNPAQFPDGVNAERMRDLGHVSMGLGAFMHAARTIRAQNESLEPHAWARLREAYAHHGNRVLVYLQTGAIPEPNTVQGDGGGALKQGWFGARKLFGSETPADVVTLCAHPEVTGFAAAGANHLVAEGFADEW